MTINIRFTISTIRRLGPFNIIIAKVEPVLHAGQINATRKCNNDYTTYALAYTAKDWCVFNGIDIGDKFHNSIINCMTLQV